MKLRFLFSTIFFLALGLPLMAAIPLAGVYEGADKELGLSRQMYVILDFINGTPDFTQKFTTKESSFKVLPKDFMNSKKITKAFSGTRAPGFSRYRSKVLFTNWEEMRITNPRLKKGIVICDWEDTFNRKGKCAILKLSNDSITIYGLSTMDPSINPNGLRLELTQNLLPSDVAPLAPLSQPERDKLKKQLTETPKETIEEIDRLPVDQPARAKKPAQNKQNSGSTANKPSSGPEADHKLPVLWREDGPTQYEFNVTDRGTYGLFNTKSTLDFWGDETVVKGKDICARWYYFTAYDNGRIYEGEYIYYGNKVGNKVIFTHRFNSLEQGYHSTPKIEKLETPVVMTSPDGKNLLFNDWLFKRTY